MKNVFRGSKDAVSNTGGLVFGKVIGINPANATYSSSDENIISFDNEAGTYTLHNPGVAYVTIVYDNVKPSSYQSQYPTYTTVIRIEVVDQ